MLSPAEILNLARLYSAAAGVALSTVGRRALKNPKFFERISAGKGANAISLTRLEVFFRANWPKGAVWPADIVPGPGIGNGKISIELSTKAFTSAKRVLQHLPIAEQTDDRLIALHANIYNGLKARQSAGRRIDDEILAAYEEILSH